MMSFSRKSIWSTCEARAAMANLYGDWAFSARTRIRWRFGEAQVAVIVFGSVNIEVVATCRRHPLPSKMVLGRDVRTGRLVGGQKLFRGDDAEALKAGATSPNGYIRRPSAGRNSRRVRTQRN